MKRRKTKSQTAVLQLLREDRQALSQEMIEERLREERIDRSTIYRILNRFEEDGIVHRIVSDDGRQYFAPCTECSQGHHRHDHLHFRCINCERVECLTTPLDLQLPAGYRPVSVNATVAGYCGDCKEITPPAPGDP